MTFAVHGDLAAAEDRYRISHAIFERLAAAEPTNADWQRDLSVFCYKMALSCRESGANGESSRWLLRYGKILRGMNAHGMRLDPLIAHILEQLGQLLGRGRQTCRRFGVQGPRFAGS